MLGADDHNSEEGLEIASSEKPEPWSQVAGFEGRLCFSPAV